MIDAIAPKLDVLQDRLSLLRADLEARENSHHRLSVETQIQDVLHREASE